MSMTETSKKALKYILYIYYLVQFWKNLSKIKTLIDLGSEVNTISPAYVKKLGFRMQKTNVDAQKIDKSCLNIFEILIASLSI